MMLHVVAKWKIIFYTKSGINDTQFTIDNDFYNEVLQIVSKINCGIDVNKITIEKINLEG